MKACKFQVRTNKDIDVKTTKGNVKLTKGTTVGSWYIIEPNDTALDVKYKKEIVTINCQDIENIK